jgi:hypothetical protein
MSQPDYFTVAEVAERYRTTEATVRYWRYLGTGPKGVKLGTHVLYPRENVEAFDTELRARADRGDNESRRKSNSRRDVIFHGPGARMAHEQKEGQLPG